MRILRTANFLCTMILAPLILATPVHSNDGPRIARWYQDREGAVSLRFDDTLESHITIAIPLLNQHGFKGTFMVNPGTGRYREHRDFWEREVPAMGHRLGNHTMNHHGARNLEEADYEIGEGARTIWSAYPKESKLLVFASGGGKKWGGKDWEKADAAYLAIPRKYHQIDLYDGKHLSHRVDARSRLDDLCALLDTAAVEKKHQPFHFHNIGSPSLKDRLRALLYDNSLTVSDKTYSGFLRCLDERKQRLWLAPLTDILKYEEEARGAQIRVAGSTRTDSTLTLSVKTDPAFYDHALTVVLPTMKGMTVKAVMQNKKERPIYQGTGGAVLADVIPENSTLTITYSLR